MPRRSTLTLSGRAVDALAVSERDVIVWDRALAGFGVRVYPSGRKVYVVQSRAGGGPRRVTLGTHGEITATQARKRAAQVIDRIKRGEEPGPLLPQAGTTVADLAERYMSAHVAQNCNAHTAGIYRGSLENHILPALGMMPLGLVERAHVSALHYRLRETPRAANRALAVLSKMFSLAAAWGLVPDGTNPCRAVRKYKERKRERFLSREEYRRLGQALAEAEAEAGREGAVSPYAIAALRLLMLTGCRLNEILTLRWDDVDRTAGEFRLPRRQDGHPHGAPHAHRRDGAGGHPPHAHQPLGHRRQAAGLPSPHHHRRVVPPPRPRRPRRRPHSRPPAFLRKPRARRRREPLHDRQALGPCRHPEHRPLRPPRARDRAGLCRQGRRQHRRRHRTGRGRREGRRVVNYSASQPARGSITECVVDALPAGRDTVIWDRALTGFGVRVYPSGAKVYVVQTRGPTGTKRITVGRHGVIGAAEARRRAALIIARIRAGEDLAERPAQKPAGPTLATLAERYLREHVAVRCKPSTAAQYRLAIERYIVPALGERAVSEIGRSQVADLQHALRDRPAMANLVIATLSRLIDQAVAWGVVQETTNPCRSAQKYRVRRRERFLTDAEFRRLGNALDELEATGRLSPHAASAIRLLMLTGCRRNEILTLRWEEVHLEAQELRLRDSKTGPRTISLSVEAAEVLAAIPKVPGNPWVIPGARTGQRLSSIFEPWSRVRARAGLDDVRIHDLRHSYASRALALGESLPVIAKLLGHAQIQTTARYTHLTRDSVKDAATRVANDIAQDIFSTDVILPARPRTGGNGGASMGDACRAQRDRPSPCCAEQH